MVTRQTGVHDIPQGLLLDNIPLHQHPPSQPLPQDETVLNQVTDEFHDLFLGLHLLVTDAEVHYLELLIFKEDVHLE